MRLLLSFLLILLSTSVFGQKQKVVTFVFTDPTIHGLPTANYTDVTDKTFTVGKTEISFSRVQELGVWYTYRNGSYYLEMNKGSRLFMKGVDGAVLNVVSFSLETFGDLSPVDQNVGSWDEDKGIWSCSGNGNITNVGFMNNGKSTLIKSITVTYTEPINVLTPSFDASQLSVASFNSLSLSFNSSVTKVGSQSLTITGNGKTYSLSVGISGSKVTLSSSEAITTDGTYTISIPEGYFQNAEGYRNKALTYTIVVNTPKNTLNYVSVNPTEGEIEKLTSPIMLTFGENLKDFSAELKMYKDDEEFAPVTIARSEDNGEVV